MTETILVVDDDASFRRVVEYTLKEERYQTSSFGDPGEALRAFLDAEFSVVVTDMRMPHLSGLDLLNRIRAAAPDVPVVVVTGHPEVDAEEAIRAGAFDYLEKPVNRHRLKLVVSRALEMRKLQRENRQLRRTVSERLQSEKRIGVSQSRKGT